jgi:hypothetical protein
VTRWFVSLTVPCALGWLVVLWVCGHQPAGWYAGHPGWSLAVLAAAVLIGRGAALGRPVTAGHTLAAAAVLSGGMAAHLLSFDPLGYVLLAGAGGR